MDIKNINVGGNEYDVCDAKARAMVSDEYDQAKSYVAGDLCIHDNKLHEATEPTTGAWDSTKWEEVTLAEVLKSQNSKMIFNMYYVGNSDSLKNVINTICEHNNVFSAISFYNATDNPFSGRGITSGTMFLFYNSALWRNHPSYLLTSGANMYIGSINIEDNTLAAFVKFAGTNM